MRLRDLPCAAVQDGSHQSLSTAKCQSGILMDVRSVPRKDEIAQLVAELSLGKPDFEGRRGGKLLSPERRRGAVRHARENYQVTERHARRLLGSGDGDKA